MVNVLCQEVVQREHVRFFGAEEDIVGQILDNFRNEKKASAHFLGRSS